MRKCVENDEKIKTEIDKNSEILKGLCKKTQKTEVQCYGGFQIDIQVIYEERNNF